MAVKQQIPSSTNAPKTLNFAKLRGVDFSTSPFEVATTRATDMRNIINEDGINHKRPGWSENTELYQTLGEYNKNLTGLYKIKDNLYLVFNEQKGVIYSTKDKLVIKEVPISTTISTSNKIKGVKFGKISEEKTLIIIQFTESKNEFIFFTARFGFTTSYEFSNGLNYAPKTTISINVDDDETATRESFEEPSLTTAWRINSLISPESTIKVTLSIDAGNDNLRFRSIMYKAGENYITSDFEFQSLSEITIVLKPGGKTNISSIELMDTQTNQVINAWEKYKVKDETGTAISHTTEIELDKNRIFYIKEAD